MSRSALRRLLARLRDERGMTLTELVVAMTVSVAVFGGTLTTFERFVVGNQRNQQQNDGQEVARTAIDQVARQLRNLASPTNVGAAIDLATDYDLVFQTVEPARRRVRYCLATSGGDTAPDRGRLYHQTTSSSAPLTTAMTAACPGTGWTSTSVVADHVVNRIGGADRDVFSYACGTTGGPSCPASSADYPKVTSMRAALFVDVNPGHDPVETRLSSGVHLRNQNEAPTASFTVFQDGSGRTVTLNGSASDDPEGRTLSFVWYKGSGAIGSPGVVEIGRGVTLSYPFPAGAGTQSLQLQVTDPAGLSDVEGPRTVVIP